MAAATIAKLEEEDKVDFYIYIVQVGQLSLRVS
jgi:hypothetical protein